MKTTFIADFEAYMPAEFNGAPYGKAGLLRVADQAGIHTCVVFPGDLPPDPRATNASLLDEARGEDRILPGCLINPTMGAAACDDLQRCADAGARTWRKVVPPRARWGTRGRRLDELLALS